MLYVIHISCFCSIYIFLFIEHPTCTSFGFFLYCMKSYGHAPGFCTSDAIVAYVCSVTCAFVCLCTWHAQVSVSLHLQWRALPAPGRCANGLANRIIMRGRAAGHFDMAGSLNGYFALVWFHEVVLSVCLKLCYIMTAEQWKRKLAASYRMFQHLPKVLRGAADRQMSESLLETKLSRSRHVNIHCTGLRGTDELWHYNYISWMYC